MTNTGEPIFESSSELTNLIKSENYDRNPEKRIYND